MKLIFKFHLCNEKKNWFGENVIVTHTHAHTKKQKQQQEKAAYNKTEID